MILSSVPTLRRKKGTEKLDPISCAHTEAKEWAQAELVRSTAALRYEPCIQFINVSQRTLHIYFIDGCRRIKIERNNLLCEQAPTEVFRSIFAWLVARLTFNYSQYFNNSNGWAIIASAWPSSSSLRSRKPQRTPTVKAPAALPVFISVAVSPM